MSPLSTALLAVATGPATGPAVSVVFCLAVAAMAVASYAAEYVFERFGESPAVSWRHVVAAVVLLILHVFWRAWAQETNIVDSSLAPEATWFRLGLWLAILVTAGLSGWLVYHAAEFTWFDRFLPRGATLVLVRTGLSAGLALAAAWLWIDSFGLLDGARLMP